MAIDIAQAIETAVPEGIEQALTLAATTTLADRGISSAELSLLLTGDETLQDLNRRYRGEDKSTDVLSFPAGEDVVDPDSGNPYFGDIAISVPYARRQAEAGGHSVTGELQLLTVHGILHLLGYDHADADQKAEMWTIQREVLDQLGLEDVGSGEDA
jgi:probable rRNA maturation factor